jgi:hypothetical protein
MKSKKYYTKIFLISVCTLFIFAIFNGYPALAFSAYKLNLAVFVPNTNKNSTTLQGKLPAGGTFIYDGTIENISSTSLSINNGQTIIISGTTVCKAPTSSETTNFEVISCSSLNKGETVRITAVKDSTGQVTAIEIEKVFY